MKTLDLVFIVHKRPIDDEIVFYYGMRERKANQRIEILKYYCTVTKYSPINLGSCIRIGSVGNISLPYNSDSKLIISKSQKSVVNFYILLIFILLAFPIPEFSRVQYGNATVSQ